MLIRAIHISPGFNQLSNGRKITVEAGSNKFWHIVRHVVAINRPVRLERFALQHNTIRVDSTRWSLFRSSLYPAGLISNSGLGIDPNTLQKCGLPFSFNRPGADSQIACSA